MELDGIWAVTTEGDCEGRTIRHLGFYRGFVDQIALSLADKCNYSLSFSKIKIHEAITPKPTGKSVNIQVPGKTDKDRVNHMTALIKDASNFVDYAFRHSNVIVRPSNICGCVKIEVVN